MRLIHHFIIIIALTTHGFQYPNPPHHHAKLIDSHLHPLDNNPPILSHGNTISTSNIRTTHLERKQFSKLQMIYVSLLSSVTSMKRIWSGVCEDLEPLHKQLLFDIMLCSLSCMVGFITSSLVLSCRKLIAIIEESYRSKNPVITPILGSIIICMLHKYDPSLGRTPFIEIKKNNQTTIDTKNQSNSNDKIFSLGREINRLIATVIGIGCGCAYGFTSPAAEIGLTISSVFSQLLPVNQFNATETFDLETSKIKMDKNNYNIDRIYYLLLAGSGAGVCANFNAPFTGALYSIEITRKFLNQKIVAKGLINDNKKIQQFNKPNELSSIQMTGSPLNKVDSSEVFMTIPSALDTSYTPFRPLFRPEDLSENVFTPQTPTNELQPLQDNSPITSSMNQTITNPSKDQPKLYGYKLFLQNVNNKLKSLTTGRKKSVSFERKLRKAEQIFLNADRGQSTSLLLAVCAAALFVRGGKMLGSKNILSSYMDVIFNPSSIEIPLFICLGIVSGVALGFISYGFSTLKDKLLIVFSILPICYRPLIGGCLSSIVAAVGRPQSISLGYLALNQILSPVTASIKAPVQLCYFMFAKLFMVAVSHSSGIIGGQFAPSLFSGAALGALFHHVALVQFPKVVIHDASVYALVGSASLIAANFRSPLTGAMLIIELTKQLDLSLPLIAATGVASLVAKFLTSTE